jgi:hypothetical protein
MPLAPLALSMLAAVVSRGLLTGSPPLAPLAPLVPPVATPLVTTPLDATPLVATPSVSPAPSPTTVPAPRPSPEPSASPSKPARHPKATTSGPAEAVAADQFSLSSRFASLTGLTYDGIAAVPTAHGTRTMLKFTMQSLRLPGMVLTVTQGGRSFVTSDSAMEFTGNVEFYTTKLTGLLGGVKVTFTSAKPPSDLPANLTLTGVTAEQPFATADLMQAAGSQASAVQAEGGVTSS